MYIDTSVIGGCEDEEFQEYSRRLLKEFQKGTKRAVVSDVTLLELEGAPPPVRQILAELPEGAVDYIGTSQEAFALAREYVREGVLSHNDFTDALHIAIATIERVDVLVSWNFRHIVNLERIRAFNAVNLKRGYPLLEIRSPREVLHEEEV